MSGIDKARAPNGDTIDSKEFRELVDDCHAYGVKGAQAYQALVAHIDARRATAGTTAAPAVEVLQRVRTLAEKWNADAVADGFAMSEPAGELLDLLDERATAGNAAPTEDAARRERIAQRLEWLAKGESFFKSEFIADVRQALGIKEPT